MTRSHHTILLLLIISAAVAAGQEIQPASDAAEAHHRRGVEYHLLRCLDDAGREYARALELDPPRELNAEEWRLVRRFAPRLYATPSEFFPLKDFAVILHPADRLIAYHFFWEDDIDFPEDNDPCDHELIWVKYSADKNSIENVLTYFHGRILEGGEAAINDARAHGMRPRVNIQWGKHGSLPVGWEKAPIVANPGAAEKKYYPLDQTITLKLYQEGTFRKLSEEGRRLADHPLGVGWPRKFNGKWEDFVNFSRFIEPMRLLDRTKMARVSRWNSATINQYFLTYNFRPKTEWPADNSESRNPNPRSEIAALSIDDVQLPPKSTFDPSMPRYPNVWFYVDASLATSYEAAVKLVTENLRKAMRLREFYGPFEAAISKFGSNISNPGKSVNTARCNIRTRFTCGIITPRWRVRSWIRSGSIPRTASASSIASARARITKSSTPTRITQTSKFARSAGGRASIRT